jgi:hypothetical protein
MSRFWTVVLAVVLVASVALSFVGPTKEVKHIWDVKTFFVVYGFVGCVVIIFVSKWLGRFWLQRGEDYYDPHRAPAEAGEGEKAGGHGEKAGGGEGDHA